MRTPRLRPPTRSCFAMANEIPLGVTRNHLQVTSLQATLKERDDEITRLTNQVSFPTTSNPFLLEHSPPRCVLWVDWTDTVMQVKALEEVLEKLPLEVRSTLHPTQWIRRVHLQSTDPDRSGFTARQGKSSKTISKHEFVTFSTTRTISTNHLFHQHTPTANRVAHLEWRKPLFFF